MIAQDSLLVQLLRLVDRSPVPPRAPVRRGRPRIYPDTLFIKALVVMVVRRIHRVGELLAVLEEGASETEAVRSLLFEGGRMPSRRFYARRLRRLPDTLPERIGLLGRRLVELLDQWARSGRAAALDSTVLFARGGV